MISKALFPHSTNCLLHALTSNVVLLLPFLDLCLTFMVALYDLLALIVIKNKITSEFRIATTFSCVLYMKQCENYETASQEDKYRDKINFKKVCGYDI